MICYSSHENLILRQELRDPACENKRGQRLPPSSLCARGKPFLSLDCSSSPALTVKSCLLVDARLPNQVLTLTLSLSLRRACGSGASDADGLLPSGLRSGHRSPFLPREPLEGSFHSLRELCAQLGLGQRVWDGISQGEPSEGSELCPRSKTSRTGGCWKGPC